MLQIGGLIVLCGLLAQTIAQEQTAAMPSDTAGNTDKNAADPFGALGKALHNGLISKDLLGSLQNLPITQALKNLDLPAELSSFLNIIDVDITEARLLELGFVPSADGHRLYATVPLALNFNVKLPLVGSLFQVKVDLNITAEVMPVNNEEGKVHLVVGACSDSIGILEITVLNGKFQLIQGIVDTVKAFATNVLPKLVQTLVCPMINSILSHLDVTLVHDIVNLLMKNSNIVIQI